MPEPVYLGDLPGAPAAGTTLGFISQLPSHGGKALDYKEGTAVTQIFIQKHHKGVSAYINCCPHAGTPLNLFSDNFMNLEETHMICRTHGALFDPVDGLCSLGPCKGRYLRQIAIHLDGDAIVAD